MILTLTEAINAAKKVLDEAGYAYYVVRSAEPSEDGRTWIVNINSISGRTTVIIDGNNGQALRILDDDQRRQR